MKKWISALLLIGAAVSCTTDDIDLFGEERYIYFNSVDGAHEIRYSFLYSEGKDIVEVALPLSYSGRLYEDERSYRVEVIQDSTTAVLDQEYLALDNMLFKPSSYKDKLVLKLKNSPRLKTSEQRLSLKLVTNDNFIAAMRDSLVMDIYMTNMTTRPAWWNEEVVDAYLGKYSDKKFELFIQNAYSGDFGALSESEKLYYARKFKVWLEKNPQYENNELITVPVIG